MKSQRKMQFRTFRDYCRFADYNMMYGPQCTKKKTPIGTLLTNCNATNCPVWKRLGALENVATALEDGILYEVYWVKVK